VKYDSCDVGRSILDNVVPTGTDKYPNYGTKSKNQIKSLISIVNHKLSLYIQQNTFRHNTGTKGIIYLDMKARVNTRVIISYNSFYNNGGYVDSSIIHFRARASPGVNLATEIPT
jgi:hypothetical protein